MHTKEIKGEVVLSPRTKIVVSLVSVGKDKQDATKDIEKLDIRIFFQNFEGTWLPTKKGVSFPMNLKEALLGVLNK